MRKSMMLAIRITCVLSMGSGWGGLQTFAETRLPIKIGYQSTSSDDWLFLAARDLKLFEKAGLAPEYVPFVAGAVNSTETCALPFERVSAIGAERGAFIWSPAENFNE